MNVLDQPPSYQNVTAETPPPSFTELLLLQAGPQQPDIFPTEDASPLPPRPPLPTPDERRAAAVKDLEDVAAVKVVRTSGSRGPKQFQVFNNEGHLIYRAKERDYRVYDANFPKRWFYVAVFDRDGQVVFNQGRIDGRFGGFFRKIHFVVGAKPTAQDFGGSPALGYVEPCIWPMKCCKPSFLIKNHKDEAVFKIKAESTSPSNYRRSNFTDALKFDIKDVTNGSLVGRITKMTLGKNEEVKDHFIVEFPREADNPIKSVILSATFIIDLMYGDGSL